MYTFFRTWNPNHKLAITVDYLCVTKDVISRYAGEFNLAIIPCSNIVLWSYMLRWVPLRFHLCFALEIILAVCFSMYTHMRMSPWSFRMTNKGDTYGDALRTFSMTTATISSLAFLFTCCNLKGMWRFSWATTSRCHWQWVNESLSVFPELEICPSTPCKSALYCAHYSRKMSVIRGQLQIFVQLLVYTAWQQH